jgi:hypothetical protein
MLIAVVFSMNLPSIDQPSHKLEEDVMKAL